MKQRIYVVEDMAITRASIISLLEQNNYDVAGSAASAEIAWNELQTCKIDLILIDINLAGKMTGLWLAEQFKAKFEQPIIFLTAYDDDATISDIAKLSPALYIRKPFQSDVLLINIKLALVTYTNKIEKNALIILDGNKQMFFSKNDVLYFKSSGNYVEIVLEKSRFVIRESLSNLQVNLEESSFVRIQRSFIINLFHVLSTSTKSLFIKETEIQISPLYREEFQQRFAEYRKP